MWDWDKTILRSMPNKYHPLQLGVSKRQIKDLCHFFFKISSAKKAMWKVNSIFIFVWVAILDDSKGTGWKIVIFFDRILKRQRYCTVKGRTEINVPGSKILFYFLSSSGLELFPLQNRKQKKAKIKWRNSVLHQSKINKMFGPKLRTKLLF